MTKLLADDVYISVDGHDISDHCFNVSCPSTREQVDMSGFGGAKEFQSGQKEDSITFSIINDFATGEVFDILLDLYQNDVQFTIKVRPTSSAVGANNPELSGTGKMFEFDGLNATLNQRAESPITVRPVTSAGFLWAYT